MAKRSRLNPDQIPLITPDTDWKLPSQLPDLRRVGVIALDTENKDTGLKSRGPGWVYGDGHVAGVGVSWYEGQEHRRIYVPVRHPDTDNFDHARVSEWVRDITQANRVIFMNAPYDVGWLHADMSVPVPPLLDDVGCMAIMLDESRRHGPGGASPYSLNGICEWLGVTRKDEKLLHEAAEAYGFQPSEVKANLWRMPARYVGPYGEGDPVSTREAFDAMQPRLIEDNVWEAYRLEMDLVPMVHAMRLRGIRLDVAAGEKLRDDLTLRHQGVLEQLRKRIGGRALTIEDMRSPQWLMRAFSNENVPFNMKGEGEDRKASFEKDWMRQGYVGRPGEGTPHWLPRMIAEAKQCHEAANKFVEGYLLEFAHRGRIHAVINQFKSEDGGTRTHRFSYADPPLQQMPSRGEMFLDDWPLTQDIADALRGLFLPESGEKWFSPDYSQQEYRLIVHYASILKCDKADEAVAKYVNDPNTDFHNMVVEMTGLTRKRAKDVNFAKSYGAGVGKFASMTGMTMDDAKNTMGQYDNEMPFVKQAGQICANAAQRRGFIIMLDGARMHFNEWEVGWLEDDERRRGWSEGWDMLPCDLETARLRVDGQVPRPYRADDGSEHPWKGKRLKRAFTHKAMNGLIQGGAARQMKLAMRDTWRAGFTPLMQMHDELPLSIAREKDGKIVGDIMRSAFRARVPFRVDEEYGKNWGDAKHEWKKAEKAA